MKTLSGPQGLRHAALESTSLNRSIAFYRDKLGFSPYQTSDADWAMLQLGDTYLSLVAVATRGEKITEGGVHPEHLGLVYASRADIEALHQRLKQQNHQPISPCVEHRDGSYGFYLADPDGNALECIFIPHRSQADPIKNEAWVLLAHGSRDPKWSETFESILASLAGHVPSVSCSLAFMEFAEPTLEEAVAKLAEKEGVRKVRIFPLFFSGGGAHMQKDVPGQVTALKKRFPGLEIHLTTAVGEHSLVQNGIVAAVVRLGENS